MEDAVAYVMVLIAAAIPWFEVLVVVPAGIIAGLPAVPVMIVATIGNLATLVPLVLVGDRLRSWWRRRRARQRLTSTSRATGPSRARRGMGRSERARALVGRYGLPGLAALGPLLTGVHVAAIAALATGADRWRTLLWMSGSVVLWSVIAGMAALIGVAAFVDPEALPNLLGMRLP